MTGLQIVWSCPRGADRRPAGEGRFAEGDGPEEESIVVTPTISLPNFLETTCVAQVSKLFSLSTRLRALNPERSMKPLSPEELAQIGKRLYGSRSWITRMSEALGVPSSTVWRWANNKMQIAPISAAAVRALLAQRKVEKALGKSM